MKTYGIERKDALYNCEVYQAGHGQTVRFRTRKLKESDLRYYRKKARQSAKKEIKALI